MMEYENECRLKLRRTLGNLTFSDLRFLCAMFRLGRGGRRDEIAKRLRSTNYDTDEILAPAIELEVGRVLESVVTKSHWTDILSSHGLASSGSRHDLLLRLIENRLFDLKESLETLNPQQLREVYYVLFSRVTTMPAHDSIFDITSEYGLPSMETVPRPSSGSETRNESAFRYDVALSFAGEDRAAAREICDRMTSRGIRVFLDERERTELWGKDLSTEFQSRYGRSTRYVVPLISKNYAVKDWTDFEFGIARTEASHRKEEFILPVRLDSTQLPGLRSTIAYLSLSELGPNGVADAVMQKLKPRQN